MEKKNIFKTLLGMIVILAVMTLVSASPTQIQGSSSLDSNNGGAITRYYQANDTGTTLLDNSGHGSDGSVTNAVHGAFFGGITGYSLSGSNQYMTTPNQFFSGHGTVFGWFRLNSTSNQQIVDSSGNDINIQIYNDNVYASINGGGNFMHDTLSVPINENIFYALSWDGSTWRLYVNSTTPTTFSSSAVPTSSESLVYGSSYSPSNFLSGYIGQFGSASYVAMNSTQISDLMTGIGWGGGSAPYFNGTVSIVSPSNNTFFSSGSTAPLIVTVTPSTNSALKNATAYVYYSNGSLFTAQVVSLSGLVPANATINISLPILFTNTSFYWNVLGAWGSGGVNNESYSETGNFTVTATELYQTNSIPDIRMKYKEQNTLTFSSNNYFNGYNSIILEVQNPDTNISENISSNNQISLNTKFLIQESNSSGVFTFQFNSYSQNYTGVITPYACSVTSCIKGSWFNIVIGQSASGNKNVITTSAGFLGGILPPSTSLNFLQKMAYVLVSLFIIDLIIGIASMIFADGLQKLLIALMVVIDILMVVGFIAIDYLPLALVIGAVVIGSVIGYFAIRSRK